jgi:hypothetical protein
LTACKAFADVVSNLKRLFHIDLSKTVWWVKYPLLLRTSRVFFPWTYPTTGSIGAFPKKF